MNIRLFLSALALVLHLSSGMAVAQNIAINAGGPAAGGFAADNGFLNGFAYQNPSAIISGALEAPAAVYKTERWGNFLYTFKGLTAGASFEVRLHFAEIFWTAAGKRVFDVTVNGVKVLSDYDIFAKAGANTAIVEKIATKADATGKVVIEFATVVDNAKVSAIQLRPLFSANHVARAALKPGQGGDGAVAAFMNGKLPALNPSQLSGSEGWAAVPAFPNLAGNFNELMDIAYVPRTSPVQMILRQRGGMVSICPEKPDVTMAEVKVFMNLTGLVSTQGNGGISSLAFHPDFNLEGSPNKDYLYVWYQTIQGGVMYNRLSRFTRNPATGAVDNATELVMIQQKDLSPFDHTGGGMEFDQEGFLVLAIGDLEWTDEEYAEALTKDTLFQCSVIRVDVNMDPAKGVPATRTLQGGLVNGVETVKSLTKGRYAGGNSFSGIGYYIPKTNPYNDENKDGAFTTDDNAAPYNKVLKEHYAKGVRNPWNMTSDPLTGEIYLFDAGSNADPKYEEINLLQAGKDYGWPYWEGPVAKTYETDIQPPAGAFLGQTDFWHYDHLDGNGNAIADGEFYRGTALTGLEGKLVFADFTSGKIWALDPSGPVKTSAVLLDGDGGVSGIDASSDGESIYILYYNGGEILKLQRVGLPNPPPPARLSDTGAFINLATLTPAAGMIPVAPASPLWSDNASKQRWIVIPNDGVRDTAAEKIAFSENEIWTFPVGSVFVKHFELPASASNPGSVYRLETRFMVHGEDGYFAFTYRWNEDGTEAYLFNDGATASYKVVNSAGKTVTQAWDFPGRAACMDCHQAAAGRVLGVKTRSLNWTYRYANAPAQNQLLHLSSKGLFQETLTAPQVAGFAAAKSLEDGSAPLEQRVRSYIDMNCSHCHMPGGVAGRATFDARMTTPLALAGLINATPLADEVGLPNPKLIKPGDPASSVFAFRDGSRNPLIQMPPVGSRLADQKYLTLLNSWIKTMGAAPEPDTDGDGIPDAADLFPADPLEWADDNGDGVGDNVILGGVRPLRALNAGGPAVSSFAADANFSGGTPDISDGVSFKGVPSGVPAGVFRTSRNGNFSYLLTGLMPSAYHRVDLFFAETKVKGPGVRRFDVFINDTLRLNDFDIFAAAGGQKTVISRSLTFRSDSSGNAMIRFVSVSGGANLRGLLLHQQSAVTYADSDGDGVPDGDDPFPADPKDWKDTDGDGYGDNADLFPNDPLDWKDSNGDGAGDNVILGAVLPLRRTNAGGGAVGAFKPDSAFSGGSVRTVKSFSVRGINGVPVNIHRTSRTGNFSYVMTGLIPFAYHRADLYLSDDTSSRPGLRRFDVFVNNVLRLNDYDIFAAAGGRNKATAKALIFRADASGRATIRFVSVTGTAKLDGIGIYKQIAVTAFDSDGDGVNNGADAFPANASEWADSDGDGYGDNGDAFPADPAEWADADGNGVGDNTVLGPLQAVRSINAGGVATGGFLGDAGFSGGSATSSTANVTGAAAGVPAQIFRTERNGNFSYILSGLDAAAYHKIELHFAEVVSTGAGKRVFDVRINGALALDNFDIMAAAGGIKKAVARTFTRKPNATGVITVQFASVTGRAKLNGLVLSKHLPAPAPVLATLDGNGDSDGDGVLNGEDAFPGDPSESVDTDGDGMGDNTDLFPVLTASNGAGRYTILVPAPEGITGVGNGYGFLTLDAKLTGHLELTMGDGTRFSQAVKVVNRQLAVDAAAGLAGGQADTLKGTVAWVSNPGVSEFNGSLQWTLGDLGTVINLQAIGSRYTPGPLQGQLKKAEALVDLLGAPTDLETAATVGGNGITWGLSGAPGVFDTATGFLIWNITGAEGRPMTIRAVYFQEQNLLGGYFDDGVAERGLVRITPR